MLRDVARAAVRAVLVPATWVTDRALRSTLELVDALPPGRHGLRVATPGQDADLVTKVETALDLIIRYAPERVDGMRQHVRAIVVYRRLSGARGRFQAKSKFVELDATFAQEASTEQLAATLVHEGEHASRMAAGEPYTLDNAWIVERGCTEAARDFAARLPNGGKLVGQLARQLNERRPDWKPQIRALPAWVRRLGKALGAPGARDP